MVPTGTHRFDTGDDEVIAASTGCGAVAVETDGSCLQLSGRENVFAGPTDSRTSESARPSPCGPADGGRFALCGARVSKRRASCVPAAEVPVELRGAGPSSRQVRNFGTPGALEASKIIACEVIPFRQLVVLSCPQARRGDGHRVGAGGDLLLRDRRRSAC